MTLGHPDNPGSPPSQDPELDHFFKVPSATDENMFSGSQQRDEAVFGGSDFADHWV